MHFTPSKFFMPIAIRANTAYVMKKNISDPRIRSLVDAFNACQSTATVWSCSGHTHEERPPREGTKPDRRTRAYLVFCIADRKGQYVLNAISEWMQSLTREAYARNSPKLEMIQLLFGFNPDGSPIDRKNGVNNLQYYPCWSLEMADEPSEDGVTRLEQHFNDLAAALRLATTPQ